LRKFLPDYEKGGNLFQEVKHKMGAGLANSKWCFDQCEKRIGEGALRHELSAYCNIHQLVNYLFGLI